MEEAAFERAKRKLLRKFEAASPIGVETCEAILDQYIEELKLLAESK